MQRQGIRAVNLIHKTLNHSRAISFLPGALNCFILLFCRDFFRPTSVHPVGNCAGRLRVISGVLGLAGLVAGCESRMSENECSLANWEQVGYQDGLAGLREDKFIEREAQCGRFNVNANKDLYLRGWQKSLEVYCTAGNGLRLGAEGGRYRGICPPDAEQAFAAAYREGQQYTLAKDGLRSAERDHDYLLSKRDTLSRRLDGLYNELAETDTGTPKRDVIQQEIDDLRKQIHEIDRYDLRRAREKTDAARRALEAAERRYERFSRSLRTDQLRPLR